ncbi:hypothetical protein RXV95_04515 [Novosphingobium sp. ZN18A2]|uniref:hypothetical protein n=1 Tax=Novosphingobium sp. ZN18A2 TaxID=3079861 RepID=UPI0030CC1D2C
MTEDRDDKDETPIREYHGAPGDIRWDTLSEEESRLIRARQRSRNRALALVLVALVVLFFAITIVKMKVKGQM